MGCFMTKDRVIKRHFMTKDRVMKGRFMTKDRVMGTQIPKANCQRQRREA